MHPRQNHDTFCLLQNLARQARPVPLERSKYSDIFWQGSKRGLRVLKWVHLGTLEPNWTTLTVTDPRASRTTNGCGTEQLLIVLSSKVYNRPSSLMKLVVDCTIGAFLSAFVFCSPRMSIFRALVVGEERVLASRC